MEDDYELFDVPDAIKPFVLKYRWSISSTGGFLTADTPAHVADRWRESQTGFGWGVGSQASGGAPAAKPVAWVSGEELYEMAGYVSCTNGCTFLAYKPKDANSPYPFRPYLEANPKAQIETQAVDGGWFDLFSRDRDVEQLLKQHFIVEIVDSDDP